MLQRRNFLLLLRWTMFLEEESLVGYLLVHSGRVFPFGIFLVDTKECQISVGGLERKAKEESDAWNS